MKNKGLTLVELLVVIAIFVFLAVILLSGLKHRPDHAALRSSCANNLRQMAVVIKMYSNESRDEIYPPNALDPGTGTLLRSQILGINHIYPEYLTDPKILLCPSSTTTDGMLGAFQALRDGRAITYTHDDYGELDITKGTVFKDLSELLNACNLGQYISYTYNPYLTTQDADYFGMLWAAHQMSPLDAEDLEFNTRGKLQGPFKQEVYDQFIDGLNPTGSAGEVSDTGGTIYRLKEGIERIIITDSKNPAASAQAQSDIPIMWDLISDEGPGPGGGGSRIVCFNHVPGGSIVLYMDGHVEFVKYNADFPVTSLMASSNGQTNGAGRIFEFKKN
jgi:prepilin-type N-terminal cleavage/methylation domain-containing protein/prepilin-type processing-associated H-X9-DG protein